MNKVKKALSLLIMATVIFSSLFFKAEARDWVTVSSWAYNDVSNFTKEDLLPESFDDVSDYTQYITRIQFADLVYSVTEKTGLYEHNIAPRAYTDTDSYAAGALGYLGIMQGEEVGDHREDGMIVPDYAFYPDRALSREEAAAVIYRMLMGNVRFGRGENKPSDYDRISGWAREHVLALTDLNIISGYEDGTFRPKENLSIEQAIHLLYLVYNMSPATYEADGANMPYSDEEQTIQTYADGITETRLGNKLRLVKDGVTLAEFDTDIYANIYCRTVDGTIYAAAQNLRGSTDIYNLATNEILFKIPYCTYAAQDDCIITKSNNSGPMTFGVYSYDGRELLPPEYSLSELEEIKNNNFEIPTEERRTADGWIYYVGEGNKGIYRIDSNGENKQKLSDAECRSLTYIDGWLYYFDLPDREEHCLKADGSREYDISSNTEFIFDAYIGARINDNGVGAETQVVYNEKTKNETGLFEQLHPVYSEDGWVYYISGRFGDGGMAICRMRPTDDGLENERLTESKYIISVYQVKDGKIYFLDCTKSNGNGNIKDNSGDLYCYEDGKTTLISDLAVFDYSFAGGKLIMDVGEDYDNLITYEANTDGSDAHVSQEFNEAANKAFFDETTSAEYLGDIYDTVIRKVSDEEYTVFKRNIWNGDYYDLGGVYIRHNGAETKIEECNDEPRFRLGNKLYWHSYDNLSAKERFKIISYDIRNGQTETAAENVYTMDRNINPIGGDWFTYTDYRQNIIRVGADGAAKEVFPSKGIHRYGEMLGAVYKDNCMYKVDTDGNYCLLTDNCESGFLYIENGGKTGKTFLHFR